MSCLTCRLTCPACGRSSSCSLLQLFSCSTPAAVHTCSCSTPAAVLHLQLFTPAAVHTWSSSSPCVPHATSRDYCNNKTCTWRESCVSVCLCSHWTTVASSWQQWSSSRSERSHRVKRRSQEDAVSYDEGHQQHRHHHRLSTPSPLTCLRRHQVLCVVATATSWGQMKDRC